ncbi:MAG TPA: response regulator [Tepidisphaeraceae bacterium]|nr:response regulator [Tepidisphaeraceae bacterium]
MSTTALIVEDEPDMADVLARLLRLRHIESEVLHEGQPAPALVRAHRPDVVLLDLMLPDRDGYSVCAEIKLDRQTNLTPIVMVTAMGRHEDLVKGLAVGANEYVPKPFEPEDLYAAIDRALAWRDDMKQCGACHEVHFQLKSDVALLNELNDMLSSLLLYTPLPADAAHQLTTAVREMGVNAIEWGHRKRVELVVTVTYRIQADRVIVTIRDTGPGFNRQDLAHAAEEDDPVKHIEVREALGLRVGGFGILMTSGLVDEMEYNEAGNEVRLVKYFSRTS